MHLTRRTLLGGTALGGAAFAGGPLHEAEAAGLQGSLPGRVDGAVRAGERAAREVLGR